MCIVSGVNPHAVMTPALVMNAFIRMKGSRQCCDLVAKIWGCGSDRVDKMFKNHMGSDCACRV